VSPTLRTFALSAIVAASALVVPIPVALIALGCLAVATAVDARLVRDRPEVERRLPPLVARGVPLEIRVTVRPAARVQVRQPRTDALDVEPGLGQGGLVCRLVANRRGRHDLPCVVTRRTGPLGLASWVHHHHEEVRVDVHPDLPSAWRLARRVADGTFVEQGRVRGQLGLGTEFEYVREYSPDDDIRQVNWSATIRAERPMSNQYRLDSDREVICALDVGRLMTASVAGDRTRLDATLDAAVALGAVADAVGDRFGALTFDDRVRVNLAPRRRGGAAASVALFDVQPSEVDSDYEVALRHVGSAKRALVVILTDLLDEAAAATLLAEADILCATHAVVIGSVVDPDEAAMLRSPPSSAAEVYRNDLLAEDDELRNRVAARLRHTGAVVVAAEPDRLASAVIAAYLRMKARARL